MSNKNSKHPRHDRRHRNASASTRAGAPGQELGHDAAAWRAVKFAAGAAGAALACAFIARKEWLPPKLITGVVSVVGAVFAVGRADTLRAVGAAASLRLSRLCGLSSTSGRQPDTAARRCECGKAGWLVADRAASGKTREADRRFVVV